MSDLLTKDEMRDQLVRMARDVLDMVDEDGGHGETMEELISAASAGDELATAVIAYLSPRMIITQPQSWADHVHTWTKVSEELTGMTQTRTYECLVCNSHTTLIGPYGATSPFDVTEEVTHDRAQDHS